MKSFQQFHESNSINATCLAIAALQVGSTDLNSLPNQLEKPSGPRRSAQFVALSLSIFARRGKI